MAEKKTPTKKIAPRKRASSAKRPAAAKTAQRKVDAPKKPLETSAKDMADILLFMESACAFLRLLVKSLGPEMRIKLSPPLLRALREMDQRSKYWTSGCL
jgi:hypothetical protein